MRRYTPQEQVDFVIVGSGAAGGIMAKQLSKIVSAAQNMVGIDILKNFSYTHIKSNFLNLWHLHKVIKAKGFL